MRILRADSVVRPYKIRRIEKLVVGAGDSVGPKKYYEFSGNFRKNVAFRLVE